jgi:hypothetical protein
LSIHLFFQLEVELIKDISAGAVSGFCFLALGSSDTSELEVECTGVAAEAGRDGSVAGWEGAEEENAVPLTKLSKARRAYGG